jgi:hypothetical protein
MSDQAKDYDLNNGVQIILNRMKTNPEEFFDEGGRWRWMFKDTLREVMTEIEKAAIFEGLKEVRRMEITSRAASTVLRAAEDEKEQAEKEKHYYTQAVPQAEGKVMGKVITSRGY